MIRLPDLTAAWSYLKPSPRQLVNGLYVVVIVWVVKALWSFRCAVRDWWPSLLEAARHFSYAAVSVLVGRTTVPNWAIGVALLCLVVLLARLLSRVQSNPMAQTFSAASEPMLREGGVIEQDPDSESGRAWHVVGGADHGGQVLSGPYCKLTPGTYLARYRVKSTLTGDDRKGHFWLDVAGSVGDGDPEAIKARAFNEDTAGSYQYRSLRFLVTEEMVDALFEFRVHVGAPGIELWVDTVTVERLP